MILDVLYENTLDIEFNTVSNYMESLDDCMIYIESADDTDILMDIMESSQSVFGKIFDAIISIFETIKEKIVSFFSRNKEKEDKINEQLKNNPNAGKEKISVADQKKLDKEYEKAKKRVENGEDPEKVLADYKKKARMIIGGLGAITIAAGTAFFLYKKSSDRQMDTLNKEMKNVKDCYKEIIKNRDRDISYLDRDSKINYSMYNLTDGWLSDANKELDNMSNDLRNATNKLKEQGITISKLTNDINSTKSKLKNMDNASKTEIASLKKELEHKVVQLRVARSNEGKAKETVKRLSNTVKSLQKNGGQSKNLQNRIGQSEAAKKHNEEVKAKQNANSIISKHQEETKKMQASAAIAKEYFSDSAKISSAMINESYKVINDASNNKPDVLSMNIKLNNVGSLPLETKTKTPKYHQQNNKKFG